MITDKTEALLNKIIELEYLCPGVHFDRNLDELVGDEPLLMGNLHFTAPSNHGGIRRYTVNLSELDMTAEEWFDAEIAKNTPTPNDKAYHIICYKHGKVQIGRSGYVHQMSFPDSKWLCPLCGKEAEFDDDTYTKYYEELEDVPN